MDHMQGKNDQSAAEVLELRCHIGYVINTLKVNMNGKRQKFSRENKWKCEKRDAEAKKVMKESQSKMEEFIIWCHFSS